MDSVKSKTDPYYPINNKDNNKIYSKYEKLAKEYNITLCGRLAEYKYYNMDMVVLQVLSSAKTLLNRD